MTETPTPTEQQRIGKVSKLEVGGIVAQSHGRRELIIEHQGYFLDTVYPDHRNNGTIRKATYLVGRPANNPAGEELTMFECGVQSLTPEESIPYIEQLKQAGLIQ